MERYIERDTIEKEYSEIEDKLLKLAETYDKKQKIDFIWEQKSGLRYVSDKSLELVYEILTNLEISLEEKEGKIKIKNNLMAVCDFKRTTEELIENI